CVKKGLLQNAAAPFSPVSAQFAEEIDHLDGGQGAVVALVACLGAGTLDGLLNGVGGEYPEEHRLAGLERGLSHALGHLGAHIVVVGGGATDDSTQADYR